MLRYLFLSFVFLPILMLNLSLGVYGEELTEAVTSVTAGITSTDSGMLLLAISACILLGIILSFYIVNKMKNKYRK